MWKNSTLKSLIHRYLGKRKWIYFAAILSMGVLGSGFQIVIARTIGKLCDIARSGDTEGIGGMILLSCLVILLTMTGSIWACVVYNDEAKRAATAISNDVYTKAFRLPMKYYDEHHSGDFMSKLIYDSMYTEDIFGSKLRRIVMPILTVMVCTVPMFYLCPPVMLGLFVLSCTTLVINIFMVKPMKKVSGSASDANNDMTKNTTNILQGMEVIRTFSMIEEVNKQFDYSNNKYAQALKKRANYSSLLTGMNTAFDLLGSLAFLALGIWYVEQTNGQIGNLVALYLLYGTFNWNFLQIGMYVPELANCLVNGERILEFMETPEEPFAYEEKPAEEIGKTAFLSMRNITFGYEGKRDLVLKDYSIDLEKNSCVAITGESGRGKSTLAKLLLGFYELKRGQILFEGKSVGEIGLKAFREKIAYVPQEAYLFEGSIAENIRYGKVEATMEDIISAAKAAHAHDFIMKLEDGYDTYVGERGNKLSGGERQRIAIARAIIRNAPILLLDEATSALDNESEYLVQDAIKALKGERLILMIAHRPSTIATADTVVKLS